MVYVVKDTVILYFASHFLRDIGFQFYNDAWLFKQIEYQ